MVNIERCSWHWRAIVKVLESIFMSHLVGQEEWEWLDDFSPAEFVSLALGL